MTKRLTLIVSNDAKHSWKHPGTLYVGSLARLREAAAVHDVERVIIDRCASADEYLQFLASLPHEIAGDVMLVQQDGAAFLSSVGRGGDRVLYALAAGDVDFYLKTHGLAANTRELARIA